MGAASSSSRPRKLTLVAFSTTSPFNLMVLIGNRRAKRGSVITDSSHINLQNLEGFAELDFGFFEIGECRQVRTSVASTYS